MTGNSSPPTRTDRTDVAVIGCGPAGGLVAGRLARDGFNVIALEKRPRVGVPVRCGEATGSREEISNFLPVSDEWIVGDINAARMYAPNGRFVEKKMPGVGLLLRRDKFDQAIARQASDWGADVRTYHEVSGLKRDSNMVTGVTVTDHDSGEHYDIDARVVIGADGVEGFVARWAGLAQHLRPREIHAGIEYLVEGEGFPTDTIEIYLSKTYAPGGYAWIFPKEAGHANVGLGVHPSKAKEGTARVYLDRFKEAYCPDARIKKVVAGGVSGSKPLKTMVADGIMLTGEAGRQNNPFSGGGIMNSLEGAEEAHAVLAKALHAGDVSKRSLRPYDKAWQDRNGHVIYKFALLRELFFKLDEDDLNRVVDVLDKVVQAQPGQISDYSEVFRAAFRATPGILWKAGKLLW